MTDRTKLTLEGSAHAEAEASLGFLFWRAFNAWSRQVRVALDAIDLTQVQFSILAATSYLGSTGEPITQAVVARHLQMDKMMVSDVVKTLEKKGWLERAPHPSDRRAYAMRLTRAGTNRLRAAVPIVDGTDHAFFGGLPTKQAESLARALAILGATAETDGRSGGG